MKKGDKSSLFEKIEKESKYLSVDTRNKYKKAMDKAEDELYPILDRVNRIEIREIEGVKKAKELRAILTTYSTPDDWNDKDEEKALEYLCDEEIINQQTYIRNYYSLEPPYVKTGTKIPEKTKIICNESRLCYVFRQYNATIVLTRTVVESIVKNIFSNHYFSTNTFDKQLKEAKKNGNISEKAYQIADKIRLLGNHVVHGKKVATKQEARQTLADILVFLEEIYF